VKKKGAINAIRRKADAYQKQMEQAIQMIEDMPVDERFLINIKGWGEKVRLVVEIAHYSTESLRVRVIASNLKTGQFFNMWNKTRYDYKDIRENGMFTIRFKNIKSYTPWKNEESPLLVNFEYIHPSFKNELFN
jgi:hypothetical protein